MKKIVILFMLAIMLCCIGCNKQGVTNMHNMVYGDQTMAMVEKCILTGAQKAGWEIEKLNNGVFEATHYVKDRRDYNIKAAIVTITYNRESYYIEYSRSVMMNYDETRNTIHKDYNLWVRQLDTAIQRELAAAELDARYIRGAYQLMDYNSGVFNN